MSNAARGCARLRRRIARPLRWWADRSVITKGLIVLAGPLLLLLMLVASVAAVVAVDRDVASAAERVGRTREASEHLLISLLNAETGVRGYLLTGEPAFLQPYEAAAEELPATLEHLQRLTAADPDSAALLARTRALVRTRRAQWSDQIAARRAGSMGSMLISMPAHMDELRALVGQVRTNEERRHAAQLAERVRLGRLQTALLWAGLAGGVVGGSASLLLFLTGIGRRVAYLERAARRVESGDPIPTRVARGKDEIGRVASALHRAGRALRGRERALRDALEPVRDLYNRAPCAYHSLDHRGVFVEVNDTELAWLGRTREEVVGRLRFPDVLTPESRAAFVERFPRFLADGHVEHLDFDLVAADGTIRSVSLSATAIVDAEGRYVASRSTMFDVTERRRQDEAVQRLNFQLSAALDEQRLLNRELEAFSYSVSHDLRAPLRALDGFSQVLLEDYGDRLDEEGRHYLTRLRAGAQRLGTLIDDLLDLARLTRARTIRRHVDLAELAGAVIRELGDAEPGRMVTWHVAPRLPAFGDRVQLQQLLQNLLGNAWKFTSRVEGARIELGVEQHETETRYFVRDNGAGFDMSYADKLFGVFQRLHHESEFPGTGVGLAIVQRIVHKHGGRVWAEGQPGAGATFWFTLDTEVTDMGDPA